MNKLLFIIITIASFIILIFVSDYVAGSYLMSDSYVPMRGTMETQDIEPVGDTMSLEEYKQIVNSGGDPGIESFEEMPLEIQLLQFNSYLIRIFILVVTVILSVFGAFVIKSNRIEFSYMALNPDERAINTTRIVLYVMVAMTAFMLSQRYPFTWLLGWASTLVWVIVLLAIMIWIMNIIYAFKERRKLSGKPLKPLRK